MQIQKTLNHGNIRWRATFSIHGKRRQRFFTSRDQARAWLNSVEADSTLFWSNRTPEEQRDIVSAFKLASERGVSVYQCILNSPAQLIKLTIPNAVEKYLKIIRQRSLRPASIGQIKLQLSQLAKQFPDRPCNNILSSHLEEWFHSRNWKRSTIDGVLAKIGPFFNWCIRENYCDKNPCKTVKRPRSDDSPPSIFTPPETLGILSLVLCWFFTGIPAWIMGKSDLAKIEAGQMNPEGKGLTMAGMICGIICCVLTLISFGIIILFMILGGGIAALSSWSVFQIFTWTEF